MAASPRPWAAAPLMALSLTLAACQSGAPAAPTIAPPSPSASVSAVATPAPTPSITLDTGLGPDPVGESAPAGDPAPGGEPAPEPVPIPSSCLEIDASPLAEQWRAFGYVLEPFDGVIVGGGFPPADSNGGTLAVHCILRTAEGAAGPHVLVELYRGADAATAVAHPSIAGWGSALLDTARGAITLMDSSGGGVVSSQETVGGHGDAVLRTVTVGMPLAYPEMTGPHARVVLFESVFGSAPSAP